MYERAGVCNSRPSRLLRARPFGRGLRGLRRARGPGPRGLLGLLREERAGPLGRRAPTLGQGDVDGLARTRGHDRIPRSGRKADGRLRDAVPDDAARAGVIRQNARIPIRTWRELFVVCHVACELHAHCASRHLSDPFRYRIID